MTLFYKELLRFWKVAFQTIAAPILTSLLYLLIFSHVLEGRVSVYDGRVTYTSFLVPGLVMMSVLQNAFANSSSSLIQSKITGNLIFVLLPPLSAARPLRRLRAGRDGARARGRARACSRSRSSSRRRFCRCRIRSGRSRSRSSAAHPRHAGAPRRDVGGQVRPARRVPEFHHRAAHVPVGRVLLDPFAAAVLAGAVARQSVLLYDRRVPLRILRVCPTSRRR